MVGLVVALGLVVSAAGAVWLLQSGKLGGSLAGDANNAQAVAEAGADQIIGVWNVPENRRLLVSGDAAPSTWTSTNQTSPCLSSTNTRPGANNGNPSADARNLVDGNFRNLDNITQTNTGDRRFRLRAVRYSTGVSGSTDRRTITRTFTVPSGTATTSQGAIPSGQTFRDLINLNDPDGSGTLRAGVHTGYIAVEVESQVFRNGVQVGTATVTKEFQVMPKCCGASFGSNNSGGSNWSGSGTFGSVPGSLGSDSRFCGVDFGMIVGINGGKFWTYYANDVYRTINPSTGTEVNSSSILGVVTNASYKFERNIASADSNNGCRVIPGPCSTSADIYVTSGASDQSLYGTGGATIASCADCGTTSDKAGNSASGVPIVPLFINGGLPSVNTRFGYTWTSGGRPAAVFATATPGPTFTSTATTTTFRLRTRKDNSNPMVEFCDGTYPTLSTTSTNCTSNSWAQISLPRGTATGTLTIGDDFTSNSYSGNSGSVNRWPTFWVESEPTTAAGTTVATTQTPTTGSVAIINVSGNPSLRLTGGSTATRSIERVINLHALQSPSLQFTYTRSNPLGTNKPLIVEYSTDNGANYVQLASLPSSTSTNSTQRFALASTLTPNPQTGYTKIRFRLGATFTASEWVAVDNVAITNSSGGAVSIDNWCEYSDISPATAQFTGGFHCLGPLLNMANGGRFIVDTSGGNVSFYYNSASDTRGQSFGSPLINMAAGAELLHVNCPTPGPLTAPPS
ncbi:hypothetical protein KBY76_13550, partial [Synechococcus sp. GreenBA-s]|nr:hypothetical protein [Synechococcus sp. GreenBA-s]